MLILGHEHSGWHEDTVESHELILEAYLERRAGELGISETITPFVVAELKRRLDETKSFSSAGVMVAR